MEWVTPSVTVIVCTILAFVLGGVCVVAFAYFQRDRISGVIVNRNGIEVHTNDIQVWSEVVGKLEQIDTNTRKSVRKATTAILLIDPKKYEASADVMLVNANAQQPLVFAAYENHHTREIAVDGGDVYLTEKTTDVIHAVKYLKSKFPELTNERCEALTCYWYIKVVAPITRNACLEKVQLYSDTEKRHDASKTVKELCAAGLAKNTGYIQSIDKLCQREDVAQRSSIIYQTQQS